MHRDVLVIDNFDSFTYNLVEDFACLGCQVHVQRNDRPVGFLLGLLSDLRQPLIVLSPGPGAPSEAGVCIELIKAAAGRYGLLGICLGHQAMGIAFGGMVERAPHPAHAQRSTVTCSPHPIFDGLPTPFAAGRYHSLAIKKVPRELRVIATADDVVMAVAHTQYAMVGLQFHPESVLTTSGRGLLENAVLHLREAA
jgi:anthranilate synthase component 2